MYLQRWNVFDYNNKYYVPNGKYNTYSATSSIQIPNCTMYCYLRMHEACEFDKKENYLIRASGGFGNAKTWYDTTTLPKGKELREGSIAVFDGNCGHVVFIEKVLDKTHANISTESNFSENKSLRDWHFWNRRDNVELVVGKATIPGVGKLIGFIYLPIKDIRVKRDKYKDQVEITKDMVNVRVGAGLDKKIFSKGLYCPVGIYNVIEFKEADGYTWAKLDDNCWVACGKDWSNIYLTSEDNTDQQLIEELKKYNKELETKLNSLLNDISIKDNKLKSIKEKIDELYNLSR